MKEYDVGERFIAEVKKVRPEGVYVRLADVGSGTISTRCWGEGEMRKAALARISPGDRMEVEVVSWHPESKTLSLVLPGMAKPKKGFCPSASKPRFEPIPAGSLLVVDSANVLGKVGPTHAAKVLEHIESALRADGYQTIFFLERRTLSWLLCNQTSAEDAERLRNFCARSEVSLVGTEADLPILQTLEVVPTSCAVTCDGFVDYAQAFPGIVGSKTRIRSFSFSKIAGMLNISIDGVRNMITIPMEDIEVGCIKPTTKNVVDGSDTVADCKLPGDIVSKGIAKDRVKATVRILSKAAKKDPSCYLALAEIYAHGIDGKADVKAAAKYEKLGYRLMKRDREIATRYARKNAQRREAGHCSCPHLSGRRISDMRIAEFSRRHDEITEYFSLRKRGLRDVA